MAEWIEILKISAGNTVLGSPLAMAEWIEITVLRINCPRSGSPLAMAEWIEILRHPMAQEAAIGLR